MEAHTVDHRAWGARFGWIVGGIAGLVAGFLATWGFERIVLQGRATNAADSAGTAATVLVPVLFLAGALGGYGFGEESGPTRYRALGVATGLSVLVFVWFVLAIAR